MGPNRYAADGESRSESSSSPALEQEQVRREELERQVRELAEENRRYLREREESQREARIRQALEERGVKKVNLALRVVGDDIRRSSDGEIYAEQDGRRVSLDEYLNGFVAENPEFLPPRIAGGSGATGAERGLTSSGFDLDSIRPGMSADETRQAWKEVARLMGQG